jgi:hypothetical protein
MFIGSSISAILRIMLGRARRRKLMATLAQSVVPRDRDDVLTGTPRAHAVDRWIYVYMAASLVVITLIGFIPDSFTKMAAVAEGSRPPFPMILHVHAVLMGSFLMLLLAQTWLAATGRIKGHMQLGVAAAALVPALVIVGFLLAPAMYQETLQAAQTVGPEAREKLQELVLRKENILLNQARIGLLFPLFIAIGLAARRKDAGLHKRMMILATASALGPAFARIAWLPTTFPASTVSHELYMLGVIAPMFFWDVHRNGYVHKAYIIWAAISFPVIVTINLLWDSPWWHATARGILT